MTDQLAAVWQPLIICNTTQNSSGKFTDPCTYGHVIQLAQNVITNLTVIATLLAVVAFIIVGFKLIMSAGNVSAKEEAKKMLWKVLLGFVWILAAWIVVYTITSVLLKDGYSILGN